MSERIYRSVGELYLDWIGYPVPSAQKHQGAVRQVKTRSQKTIGYQVPNAQTRQGPTGHKRFKNLQPGRGRKVAKPSANNEAINIATPRHRRVKFLTNTITFAQVYSNSRQIVYTKR